MTLEEAKKLKPEEINYRIAEALGWKWYKSYKEGPRFLSHPSMNMEPLLIEADEQDKIATKGYSFWNFFNQLCDYFHDLNACLNSVTELNANEWHRYARCMTAQYMILTGKLTKVEPEEIDWDEESSELVDAPASIRAIALAVVLSERTKHPAA